MTKRSDRTSFHSFSEPQRAELGSFLSRGDGFFVVPSSELPKTIPQRLRDKWDSALAIVSGSTTDSGVLVLMGHRIDLPAGQMDHHPFAVACSSSVAAASGLFIDHLEHPSRSIDLPPAFLSAVNSSGVSNYYYGKPPFQVSSGSLSELPQPAKEMLGKVISLLSGSSAAGAV